jgi:hypothetical protein
MYRPIGRRSTHRKPPTQLVGTDKTLLWSVIEPVPAPSAIRQVEIFSRRPCRPGCRQHFSGPAKNVLPTLCARLCYQQRHPVGRPTPKNTETVEKVRQQKMFYRWLSSLRGRALARCDCLDVFHAFFFSRNTQAVPSSDFAGCARNRTSRFMF